MELNSKSWYSWYYKQFYNTKILPQSLCIFFWKILLAIVLLPFIYPILLFRKVVKDHDISTSFGLLLWFIGFIGCTPIVIIFKIKSWYNLLWLHPLGLIIMGISIGMFIAIVYIIYEFISFIYNKYNRIKIYKEPKENIVIVMTKAFFGKYCPKIKWLDN